MRFGKFGFHLASFSMIVFAGVAVGAEVPPGYRDLYSDTWVAQDAAGRNMPSFSEAGPVKTDKCRNGHFLPKVPGFMVAMSPV